MASTLISLLQEAVVRYPSLAALKGTNPDGSELVLTYGDLYNRVRELGTGLISIGLAKGTRVALVAENGWRWLATDLAVLGCGATDVPLPVSSADRELEYVLNHAECDMVIVEGKTVLDRVAVIRRRLPRLRRIIAIDLQGSRPRLEREGGRLLAHPWEEVLARGQARLARGDRQFDLRATGVTPGDTATLAYGLLGRSKPRGVMLSHGNIMHNVTTIRTLISPSPGDAWLSVLPVWQPFERTAEYCSLSFGCTIVYSRPLEWRMFDDLRIHNPAWLVVDPPLVAEIARGIEKRIGPLLSLAVRFEKFYGVFSGFIAGRYPRFRREERALEIFAAILPLVLLSPAKLASHLLLRRRIGPLMGGGFRGIICGGPLATRLDRFFDSIGILVLEGYGLPEASAVVSLRSEKTPVLGTAGRPLPWTEVQVVGESGEPVQPGQPGSLRVRGPQVMLGYFKDEAASREVVSADGWLATGDTAMVALDGSLVIMSTSRPTITLRGGERFEPEPVEQAVQASLYVHDAVVVGDHRDIPGLLIVPDLRQLARWARTRAIPFEEERELAYNPAVYRMLQEEVSARLAQTGLALPGGRMPKLAVLPSRFEVGREITRSHVKRREVIDRLYEEVIDRLYRV